MNSFFLGSASRINASAYFCGLVVVSARAFNQLSFVSTHLLLSLNWSLLLLRHSTSYPWYLSTSLTVACGKNVAFPCPSGLILKQKSVEVSVEIAISYNGIQDKQQIKCNTDTGQLPLSRACNDFRQAS
jgi:hypothetical protein